MEPLYSSLIFLSFLLLIIIVVILIHNKWKSLQLKAKIKLPPSPRKLPIIGNFHQVGFINPERLQVMSTKYGPIMLVHLGNIPTVVASSVEAAKEILKTNDISFCSRPNLAIPNILFYGSKDIAFAPYGENWRHLKRIVVLHLLSNTQVSSYHKVRENEIRLMISMLEEGCGTTVDMGTVLGSLTINIISLVALGRKFDGIKHKLLLKKFVHIFTLLNVGSYVPWLSWVDHLLGSLRKAKNVAKEFDHFLEDIINEHLKKKQNEDAKSDEEKDFLDILLDVQKDTTTGFTLHMDSIKAVILDVFVGGTDTTAITLEWALSELVRKPRIMKKLQQEVTELAQGRSMVLEEDLEKMQYLKAVIKESLRLHVPNPFLVPRVSMKDVKLMGYDIPAGTQVIINARAIGRDPSLWVESKDFMPERFLNKSVNYQDFSFEWLPFGSGRRSCPGIQFSGVVMELALANIVYKFDLTLADGTNYQDLDMSETFGLEVRKKSPLMVKLSPRF